MWVGGILYPVDESEDRTRQIHQGIVSVTRDDDYETSVAASGCDGPSASSPQRLNMLLQQRLIFLNLGPVCALPLCSLPVHLHRDDSIDDGCTPSDRNQTHVNGCLQAGRHLLGKASDMRLTKGNNQNE